MRFNTNRKKTVPNDIKDKYFFIDYLRLHSFGKQNKIWSKNRNMLVKADEYGPEKSRKGYKSYIQRCTKSILDWLFPGFMILKPRNVFGYEIGKRNYRDPESFNFQDKESVISYIVSRNMIDNSFQNIVGEYKTCVDVDPNIQFKNNYSGLKITFDPYRSMAYPTIKNLIKVKEAQEAMVNIAQDKAFLIKEILCAGLKKAIILEPGIRVMYRGEEYIVKSHESQEYSRSNGVSGTAQYYNLERVRDGAKQEYVEKRSLKVVSMDVPQIQNPVDAFVDRVILYANENLVNSQGVDKGTIFNLARSALIRSELANGTIDPELAVTIRHYYPDSRTLDRIELPETEDFGEEDFDEENDEF